MCFLPLCKDWKISRLKRDNALQNCEYINIVRILESCFCRFCFCYIRYRRSSRVFLCFQKIGRPWGLYFPGESSKPVVPEPVVRNSQNSTHHEDTHQRSTHHREGRQSSRETKTTDSLKEQPTVFKDLHIVKGFSNKGRTFPIHFISWFTIIRASEYRLVLFQHRKEKRHTLNTLHENEVREVLVTTRVNELTVTGPSAMRKGFWYRHRANNANYYKWIYDEKLFRRPKNGFLENSALFFRRFIREGLKQCWYVGSVSFCPNNHEICVKIYR